MCFNVVHVCDRRCGLLLQLRDEVQNVIVDAGALLFMLIIRF